MGVESGVPRYVWVATLLWVEVVIQEDGRLSMVRCKVCNVVEHCEKLFVPKFQGWSMMDFEGMKDLFNFI